MFLNYYSGNSNERQFLKDFVNAVPGSSGARLAAWLQPESRLDPNKCELKPIEEPVRYGWPTELTIVTRDQYGDPVYVPNLKVRLNLFPKIKNVPKLQNIFLCEIDSNKSNTICKWCQWQSKGEAIIARRYDCL